MIINGYEIKPHANLRGADLKGADLKGVDLEGANLRGAFLRGADLYRAYLEGAFLKGADLRGADLKGANLKWANLKGAKLEEAYLWEADLSGANLKGAFLRGAFLRGADLRGANLKGANLEGADLRGTKNIPQVVYDMFPIPEGELIVYKKLKDGVICKLKIPADAKRSRATTNKYRAEFAEVLEGEGRSKYNNIFFYKVGKIVKPVTSFNEDRWAECSSGIHFFLTRKEAEEY